MTEFINSEREQELKSKSALQQNNSGLLLIKKFLFFQFL